MDDSTMGSLLEAEDRVLAILRDEAKARPELSSALVMVSQKVQSRVMASIQEVSERLNLTIECTILPVDNDFIVCLREEPHDTQSPSESQ